MSDFVFAEPGWARLLWLVAGFAVLLFWLERRGATALGRFIAADLQPRLLRRPGRWRRALRLGALVLVGVACSIALMRPQWGLRAISSPVSSAEIMICLDVSRSMLADDVAPNRLQRAKAELRDLLGLLDGDRVGLIAFAGRASILSPLTPDFGFLRLALDGASANSVRRGGTRLEEPIRKAIEAFGASGDAARSILLITDGEDHDSIPLDAARAAAERGIRILAIGFGSETGSEIRVTDPDTGARVPLRDGRGAPVVSRLDGELLREMALITDGAYIPAGTGVLDLESIYRAHIAPLTRAAGERTTQTTRSARHEAFQVPLLLALLALLVALLSPLRARRETSRAQPRRRAAAAADNDSPGPQNRARSTTRLLTLALVAMLTVGLTAQRPGHAAQTSPAVAANGNPAERHDDATAAATSTPQASTRDVPTPGGADAAPDNADAPHDALPQDPREAYNLGQRLLAEGELSRAIQVLGEVRERSGTDEAVRFRATYNLGWAAARHAEMLVEQAPEQALEQLQSAQEWFRRAIELRPENEAARINLETVLDRLLALQDSLRKRDPQDLGQRLDELVEAQRGLLGSVREQTRGPDAAEGAQVSEQSRRAHRRLAADALQILSRADKVNEAASLELDALRRELNQAPAAGASEPPVDPGQQLRAAQLDAALHHLHTARERLAQARSQIRRNALQRGHRRAAAALDAFKRSRDQLHDPVTRLDRLIVDTRGQAALTAAAAGSLTPLADPEARRPQAPAWLEQDYLIESQERLNERVDELYRGFEAAAADAGTTTPIAGDPRQDPTGAAADTSPVGQDQARARLGAQLRAAVPLLDQGRQALNRALLALRDDAPRAALAGQSEAIARLSEAREHFLDLRQLIELVHARERGVAAALAEPGSEVGEGSENEPPRIADALLEEHARNVERSARLGPMITDEALSAASGNGEQPAASGGGQSPQAQQLQQAYTLWGDAQQAMYAAQTRIEDWHRRLQEETTNLVQQDPAQLREQAAEQAQDALDALTALRRLFFSLLEHLKDTASRQQELLDRTDGLEAESGSLDTTAMRARAGPLAIEQSELARISTELADAFAAQAEQSLPAPTTDQQTAADSGAHDNPMQARLETAGKLVGEAQTDMQHAQGLLEAKTIQPQPLREAQTAALDKLARAIALFDEDRQNPQPQDSGQSQDSDGQQDEQSGQPADQGEDAAQSPREMAERGDLERLLQGVRDREARRRESRANHRGSGGYETVEKDW